MMKLGDFVRDAIVEIVKAVKEAQAAAETVGARVNPANLRAAGSATIHDGTSSWHVEDVHFDIAVTATEGSEAGSKIGVVAGIFGAGATGSLSEQSTHVSRIQFAVPVAMPPHLSLTTTVDDGMGGQVEMPRKGVLAPDSR